MIVLSVLFGVSILIIGFLVWYSFNALHKLRFMSQSIEDLDLGLQTFEKHLKYIYELDMYYGDQTLEGLISHAKDLNNEFAEFRKDYDIFNGDLDEKEFFDQEQQEEIKNNETEE